MRTGEKIAALLVAALCVSPCPALAAPKAKPRNVKKLSAKAPEAQQGKINNVDYAKPLSPDKSLRLKKLFLFPAVDDINNVLAPQLNDYLRAAFEQNNRFEIVKDPGVVKALAPDEAGYVKVATNEAVHKEAAKITGADSTLVLRTRTVGGTTEMTLDWHDGDGKILFSESGTLPGFSSMDARAALIKNLVNTEIKKIPYLATVTGRTAQTITVDLGRGSVNAGDSLEIVKLVSVQRHPLLHTLINVDYVHVGTARVTNVDRVLSFAEIVEEANNENILPDNKIVAIKKINVTGPEKPAGGALEPAKVDEKFSIKEKGADVIPVLSGDFDKPKARYGFASLDLGYGSLSHMGTASGVSSDVSGSGVALNFSGEIWVTKQWILASGYATQSAELKGTHGSGAASLGATTASRLEFSGGYKMFPGALAEGTAVIFGLGYQQLKFDYPSNTTMLVGPKKYSGLMLRLGADLFITPDSRIMTNVKFQPFSGLTETGSSPGSVESANVVAFDLAYLYQFSPNFWLKAGINFDTANGSYAGGSTTSDKKFAIGPGIAYSF